MLEQVSNFQAVKKAPFEAQSSITQAKNVAQQNQPQNQSNEVDFKTALQKSIQNQKSNPKDTPATQNPTNAKNPTQSLHDKQEKSILGSANPLAHKNATKNHKNIANNANFDIFEQDELQKALQKNTLSNPSKIANTDGLESFMADKKNSANSLAKNALLQEKIDPKNALESNGKTNPKTLANTLNSLSNNASKALPKSSEFDNISEVSEEDFLPNEKDTNAKTLLQSQNLGKESIKKDLNQMAKQKEQKETFLSKIMQNQQDDKAESNADTKTSAIKNAQEPLVTKNDDNADELDFVSPFGNAQNLASTNAQASTQSNMQPNAQGQNPKSLQTPLNSQNPTLENVANKAKELGLNPSKLSYKEEEEETFATKNLKAKSSANKSNASNASNQTNGIKTYFDSENAEELRPIFDLLESFDARNAQKRRAMQTNTSKTKYIQNGEDKIAVIERSKSLPKSITAQRIKNERQEKIFEQIQKDLLAGKELNLSQIELELSKLENELFDDKTQNPNPLKIAPKATTKPNLASQNTSPTNLSAVASTALSSKQLNGDSNNKNGSKNKETRESKEAKTQSDNAKNPSKITGEPLNATTLESSADKAQSMPAFAQNELEQNAQNLNETAIAKQAQKQESTESKAESKNEAKTLASTASSTSALKADSRTSNINPREALSSFVQQFEQEIKRFKPPMRQISMELSPKELGNIELTITQRGNSLHISVVSNPQALQLFAQNHNDLRQNLLNAGFEGVDLSFSSNGGNSGNGSNSNNGEQNSDNNGENRQNLADSSTTNPLDSQITQMEITLPRYA
ncbi:flagellar hook-length control protein FliK [Helicobacter sp. T3_23-1056]